jgi:phosphate:Na+ symporter
MIGDGWGDVALGLAGGLALFLLGIETLTTALKTITGDRLRSLLARASRRPVTGAASGALVTGLIQSSSITTVLLVGFVSAGAMSLQQSVGIILGANVGSTATMQIIAFDVTRFSLGMLAVGFAGSTLERARRFREPSRALMGIGMVFFGMALMSQAALPFREQPWVQEVLVSGNFLLAGVLMGAVVTAIIQSSAATAGILVVLASQGLLDLQMGIAIALGANVGTCVTAALAAIGRPRAGARVAAVHVIFNVVGVLVWVWFIPQLEAVAVWLSPTADHLVGSARIAAETPRQLANAHTLFNVVNVLLFIGFTRPLARFAERLLPDRPEDLKGQARYLDDDVLDTPDVALELARREIARLGERVREIVAAVGPTILHGSVAQLQQLEVMDDQIDLLYADIMGYLRRIGLRELAQEQSAELLGLVAIASDLEAIGDIVEVNLTHLGHQRVAHRLRASGPTERVVMDFHRAVLGRITAVVEALGEEDPDRAADLARDVAMRADDLVDRRQAAVEHLGRRLHTDAPNRVATYELETSTVNHLYRIGALARHVASSLVRAEEAG